MMKVHDPPNPATVSAIARRRSPRFRSLRWDCASREPAPAAATRETAGRARSACPCRHAACAAAARRCRAGRLHADVASSATASVWCGVCSSIEAKPKNSPRRLVDHHFLVILVHGRDPHRAGHHDVGVLAGVADLVDPLPRRETARARPARPALPSHRRPAAQTAEPPG